MLVVFFFFQAEDGIRDYKVTGVQTCALPILAKPAPPWTSSSTTSSWKDSFCPASWTRRASSTSTSPAAGGGPGPTALSVGGRLRFFPHHTEAPAPPGASSLPGKAGGPFLVPAPLLCLPRAFGAPGEPT